MTTAARACPGRRAILAMAAGAVALAAAPHAHAGGEPVDLTVVDRDTGEPLRIWRHRGRAFVAGRPGARYGLRVTNNTGGRVLVVMSVDGVNILTGETAGFDQRGYVFDPYETYDVSGWRKSDTEVAAFTFASLPQSYAARTGRPGDVGVIGLAVFRERYVPPPPRVEAPVASAAPQARDHSDRELNEAVVTAQGRAAAPESSRTAPPRREERLGTAHGRREWSAVSTVYFERATRYPEFTRQIEYNTYRNLIAAGVIPPLPREHRPRPFPSGGGYVPDPPGGR